MKNNLKQNIDSESAMIDGLKKILFCNLVQIKEEYHFDDKLFFLAKDFLFLILKNNLIPRRVTDLHEDGYAFNFVKDKNEDIEIWFEIYPDGEFGYIAFDKVNNYKLVANEDIVNFNHFIEFMKT
jgi:hypothetical protein